MGCRCESGLSPKGKNGWRRPTCAGKLLLLHLGHVVAPQVWRGHALSVEAQTGALSQPLRQPGDVTVTLQVVGVQTAEEEEGEGWMDEETDGRREGRRQEDATHKVLSLGMWLKLATDRRLMLLLLRVLRSSERNTVRSGTDGSAASADWRRVSWPGQHHHTPTGW